MDAPLFSVYSNKNVKRLTEAILHPRSHDPQSPPVPIIPTYAVPDQIKTKPVRMAVTH